MFVINTNKMNTWYNEASVSWEYDIPMDWSTYTMFHPGTGDVSDQRVCQTNVYSWWDWNNPNECSVLEYAKARDFDVDVVYPYNILPRLLNTYSNSDYCNGNFQFYTKFYFNSSTSANCCIFRLTTSCLNTVEEIDMWEQPAHMLDMIVSRKVFEWWEVVWKKIKSFLNECVLQDTVCWSCITQCCWAVSWSMKCPITYYVDLWLLHEDWTKTSIKKIETNTPYWHMNENGSVEVVWESKNSNIINWIVSQEWVTACPGDRLYFEQGICPRCAIFDTYTTAKTSSSCTQLRNVNVFFSCNCNCHYLWWSTYRQCLPQCSYAYHTWHPFRFEWIQFSIE